MKMDSCNGTETKYIATTSDDIILWQHTRYWVKIGVLRRKKYAFKTKYCCSEGEEVFMYEMLQ